MTDEIILSRIIIGGSMLTTAGLYLFSHYKLSNITNKIPKFGIEEEETCTSLSPKCFQIIEDAKRRLKIKKDVLFYETKYRSCAILTDDKKRLVAINQRDMLCFKHPFLVNFGLNYRRHLIYFYKVIYHELCHIRFHLGRKNTFSYIQKKKISDYISYKDIKHVNNIFYPPSKAEKKYGLYTEMEAELTAIFFTFKLTGHDSRDDYDNMIEDKYHPSRDETKRYAIILLDLLKKDHNLDYWYVKELAKHYLIEKEPWFQDWF
jgi:hypothetical protein